MFITSLAAAILTLAAHSEIIFYPKQGPPSIGRLTADALPMTTTFGTALIDADQITRLHFGDITTVTTRDFTVLRGFLDTDEIEATIDGATRAFRTDELSSISFVYPAAPRPGMITEGLGRSGLTWCLRVPENWDAERHWPALILFHGSNMNSRAYVQTVAAQWPELAARHILIGVNGERHNAASPPDNPTFNYTYVNYVGRSKYRGYPGTDRESPALVAEMIVELKERLPIERIIIAGHSQGGFLTYSVMMNTPELIDGAIVVSGGLIIQAEPEAYEDEELKAAQRQVPLAIVHGSTDQTVNYSMATYAHGRFEKAGFTQLKLFDSATAGHRFAHLPVEEAVHWIEAQWEVNAEKESPSDSDAGG